MGEGREREEQQEEEEEGGHVGWCWLGRRRQKKIMKAYGFVRLSLALSVVNFPLQLYAIVTYPSEREIEYVFECLSCFLNVVVVVILARVSREMRDDEKSW